jgi:hypothetical protein
MENFTTLKDAQIVDINGLVQTESAQNAALQNGESIQSGTVLTFAEGSEITLAFEDGSEQTITAAPDETMATETQTAEQLSTQAIAQSPADNEAAPDNVQADLDAIVAEIEDEGGARAGGLNGNEGTDFVTLERDGNELLAGAGFATTELDNPLEAASVFVDPNENVNALPDAVDDTFGINENTQLTGTLLGNDELGDEATTVTDFDNVSVNGATVTVDTAGNFTYAPVADFVGADTFTYTITDADGDESTATVTVDVANVNKLADAVDDSFIINENTTLNNNVIGNDELGDPLTTVTPFNITAASGRTVSMDANGNFNYSPAPNFTGIDTFNYTITDADGDTSTATVSVIVNDVPVVTVDLLPNAVDDTYAISENTTLTENVLGNDNLGDPATTVAPFSITTANGGSVSMGTTGEFSYTPVTDFTGTDTFNYTITDADGDTSTATVTVNVNDLPDAIDDTFVMTEGETLSGNIIGNDDQGDGPATVTHIKGGNVTFDLTFDAADDGYATFTIIDGVYTAVSSTDVLVFDGATDNGILRINEDGAFTYENKGFLEGSPAPTFEYTLSDGIETDTAIVSITVNTNTPVANPETNPVSLEAFFETGTAYASDVEGNVVTGVATSDNPDSSYDGFGSPAVTQVVFKDVQYLLDASNNSENPIKIDTDYGTLFIDNTGYYQFSTPFGMDLPDEVKNLEFNYTIQDGDIVNPETASADLIIEITPPQEAEGRKAPEPSAKSVALDLDETSGTIDTDFDAKTFMKEDKATFKFSPDLDDLSDILTDGHTGGLETYLVAMGEDESALVDIDLAVALKDFQVDDSVTLEKSDANSEHASFTSVTNGFLADGAIIISDVAEATNAPIAELDSAELL